MIEWFRNWYFVYVCDIFIIQYVGWIVDTLHSTLCHFFVWYIIFISIGVSSRDIIWWLPKSQWCNHEKYWWLYLVNSEAPMISPYNTNQERTARIFHATSSFSCTQDTQLLRNDCSSEPVHMFNLTVKCQGRLNVSVIRTTIYTSNGSWRQGIKGEMTCTVYVALVWNIIYWIMMIITLFTE